MGTPFLDGVVATSTIAPADGGQRALFGRWRKLAEMGRSAVTHMPLPEGLIFFDRRQNVTD